MKPIPLQHRKIIQGIFSLTILVSLYIFVRIFYKGGESRIFLYWNLFLAWIPMISIILIRYTKNYLIRFSLFTLWYIFFPNALYLITDLKHINHRFTFIPYWLDIIILFLVAVIGIALSVVSLYCVLYYLKQIISSKKANNIIWSLVILTGFGIYLGRFPRLNSWYVITNPELVLRTVGNSVQTIFTSQNDFLFVLLFTLTLFVCYRIYLHIFNDVN